MHKFYVMYDNHTFKRLDGPRPEDAVAQWKEMFTPWKKTKGGEPALCPVCFVDDQGKESRPKAGDMVHDVSDETGTAAWLRDVNSVLSEVSTEKMKRTVSAWAVFGPHDSLEEHTVSVYSDAHARTIKMRSDQADMDQWPKYEKNGWTTRPIEISYEVTK